jgi:hypothetical protein
MRLVWRAAVVLAVFAGVGWFTARAVIVHALAGGAPIAEVRLDGAMAGLFAGGAAAVVVIIAMAWRRS